MGWPIFAAVVGALGLTAIEVRRAVLPQLSGAPARLAEVVVALTVALTTAQVMGAARWLAPWPIFVALLVVCGAVGITARRLGRRWAGPTNASTTASPPSSPPRWQLRLAVLGAGVVVIQWCAHTADALARGMPHPDTMIYHQPISARFLQDGHFMGLATVAYDTVRYYPFNAHLVQSLVTMPFGDDRLAPYVNLGWLALALAAAWVMGAQRGVGHLAVLGAAAGLGVPALAGTQPGQASTDIASTALLMTALALLVVGRFAVVPVTLAGLALGLAIGTKVTIAAPVLAVFGCVLVAAVRTRRWRAVLAWTVGVVAGGSCWYVRNWFDVGSPLPWFEIDLGFLRLPTSVSATGHSLVASLSDGELPWASALRPGLEQALGPAWPVVVLLPLVGAALAVDRGDRMDRIVGLSVVFGVVGYAFTPQTGGQPFVFNIRYVAPVLTIGMVLLATLLPARRRATVVISLLALIVVTATGEHAERTATWPWPQTAIVVVSFAVVAGLVVAAVASARRGHPAGAVATVVTLVAAVGIGGLLTTRHYLDARYRSLGLPDDAIHEAFRDIRDARVVALGSPEVYPLYGLDLSNRVDGVVPPDDRSCAAWRTLLGGTYDYVVISSFGFGSAALVPPEDVISSDPAARLLVRAGDSAAYELSGPLDPTRC